MTALPEHPVSGRLALFAMCGELVIAIDAMAIREIRRTAEVSVRGGDRGMSVVEIAGELEAEIVPGWDLGELLGVETAPSAWVIVEVAGVARPVGFQIGRCVMVQSLPVCRALPSSIFTRRPQAIAAGFSTAAIPELSGYVSGVVIDLSRLLGEGELAAIASLRKPGREARLQA